MPTIKEVIRNAINGTGSCGTGSIKRLSLQIIAEMNLRHWFRWIGNAECFSQYGLEGITN